MRSVQHVSVDASDQQLSQIAPILAEFNEMVVWYCEQLKSPPYWFTERASVSLLAAAAWRKNWLAVEEYSTRKVLAKREDPNQPVDRHGRCDLYLRSPTGVSFAIEAKQVVAKPNELTAASTDALKRARTDARQLFSTEATCRVALAFVIPTLPATPEGEHDMPFDSWLSECRTVVQGPRRINHSYVVGPAKFKRPQRHSAA